MDRQGSRMPCERMAAAVTWHMLKRKKRKEKSKRMGGDLERRCGWKCEINPSGGELIGP